MTDSAQALPRWKLRLQNYESAIGFLVEAVELGRTRELSELEKAGTIQRLEIAWELGWKLMADYLTDALSPPVEYTPTKSIRAAMSAGLIDDGDAWIAAGRLRNQLSHTYSKNARDLGLAELDAKYLAVMEHFRSAMAARALVA